MKKLILIILIAVFGMTSVIPTVVNATPIYEQKKGDKKDDKKKDPPGPPIVKPKEPRGKPDKGDNKDNPRKGKKPGNE